MKVYSKMDKIFILFTIYDMYFISMAVDNQY